MSDTLEQRALVLVGDPTTGRLLEHGLRELGYDVEVSATALEVLARVRTSPPQIIVLDLAVGGGGGLALLQVLRRSRSTREVPVLVVGAPGPALMEQAYELNAAGPFSPDAADSLARWVCVATSRYSHRSSSSSGADTLAR